MIISKLEITNFAGVSGTVSFSMPHILALCGKNGMGKTTVLNALRYILTGEEPEGESINALSNSCSVKMWLPTEESGTLSFERIKERDKASKCKINGKTATAKVMNEKIEDIVGIPLDKIKILSSADIIAAMKPQEFSSLILSYIPERLTLEKVISFMPSSTIGVIELMEANLPEDGIDIEVLNHFDEFCRENRKAKKAELAAKKLVADEKRCEKPEESKEDLEDRLSKLLNLENEKKIYEVKKSSCEREAESIKKIDAQIAALKEESDKISVSRPDPTALKILEDEVKSLNESLDGQKNAIFGMKSALGSLETTLVAINESKCPISPLIKCTTDKSSAKAEIEESIEATKAGIVSVEAEIEKIGEKIAEDMKKISEFNDLQKEYNRKIELQKQIKLLEDSRPVISPLPAEPDVPENLDALIYQIKNSLKIYDDFNEYNRLLSQIEDLETEVADYELLVKVISEKGAVRTGIVNSYLGMFEDICNERSGAIRSDVAFKLESDNGVVVKMSTGAEAPFLPYASLSGGERAYMLYIIIDMLNQLVGTKLLVLDELSVVDEECFGILLDLIVKYSADYDHIILSAVDHKDTVDAFVSHSIPTITNLEELKTLG